jgi:hypothetical protein
MGGSNSGRTGGYPTSGRTQSFILNLSKIMQAMKGQPPGAIGTIRYGEDGSLGFVEIALALDPKYLDGMATLKYELEQYSRRIPERTQYVRMFSEPCRFGGRRWFCKCPSTGRKCTKLFLPNGADHWRSRNGFKLAYDVQREAPIDRLLRRLKRLYDKNGMTYSGHESCWPSKPPRMRQTTYTKIEAAILQAEDKINAAIEVHLGGFLRRYGEL